MNKLASLYEALRSTYVPDVFEGGQKTASVKNDVAREIFEDRDAPAPALVHAAHALFGTDWLEWEPDTIRLEVATEKLRVPDVNFDALFAAQTLLMSPAYYEDALVFENTVETFNDHIARPESLQAPPPAHIAWANEQAHLILHGEYVPLPKEADLKHMFAGEVVCYTAGACKHLGMVLCPEELIYARERLAELTPHAESLRQKAQAAWNALPSSRVESGEFQEDEVGVQLAMCAAVRVYVEEERAKCLAYLRRLGEKVVELKKSAP